MQTEPTLRRARVDDYEAVTRLFGELDTVHRERLPWIFEAPESLPRTAEFFAEALSREDSALFVADAGSIVGIAHGMMRSAPELPIFVPQRWGVLDSLVVDSAWRRRGIGRLLAKAVEEWAVDQGASWVEANVYEVNAEARQFYEALGYLPLRTTLRKPRLA
jgi:GNAT superfamily N-acetyltransferase